MMAESNEVEANSYDAKAKAEDKTTAAGFFSHKDRSRN